MKELWKYNKQKINFWPYTMHLTNRKPDNLIRKLTKGESSSAESLPMALPRSTRSSPSAGVAPRPLEPRSSSSSMTRLVRSTTGVPADKPPVTTPSTLPPPLIPPPPLLVEPALGLRTSGVLLRVRISHSPIRLLYEVDSDSITWSVIRSDMCAATARFNSLKK